MQFFKSYNNISIGSDIYFNSGDNENHSSISITTPFYFLRHKQPATLFQPVKNNSTVTVSPDS